MATTTQVHDLARDRHQDTPRSSANTSNLQVNEQAPHDTRSQRCRNPSDNELPTVTSERAKDTGGTCISIDGNSTPQEGHDSFHSHAITLASHIQDPGDENQNVSSFFPYARDFQINNSTFIEVNPSPDTETPSFTESRGTFFRDCPRVYLLTVTTPDGQKLKKALIEGLEFISLAKGCMQDTRVAILSDVDAMIHDNEDSNIIWIKGFPGVGKSAIASTIVYRLRERGELLSYFVFDRAKPTVTTAAALWRRVAWDLARSHPFARQSLLKCIDDETLDTNTTNISSLFTYLIVEPLSGLGRGGLSNIQLRQPVVVVIDAADECGGLEGPRSDDRKALLRTLEQWHSKLPRTSSIHIHISITTDEASRDIRKYLEDRLDSRAPAKRAAGVFIWATTIANFIEAGEPQSWLKAIDAGLGLWGKKGSLNALYACVLKISFGDLHGEEAEAFKTVVGAMIFAQRPFHDSEFTAISPVVTGSMLEYIRNGLRSVIDQGATLRFIHQSFVDFLLSSECPDEFAIKEAEQQHQLSTLCLTIMSKQLRFNICGLETSSLKNADVPDFKTKVKAGIPSLLSYASHFVAEHLRHTPFDERLMDNVRAVFKEKLLYWLEVMSLLKETNRMVPVLRAVLAWITGIDTDFTEFVRDALRFIAAFSVPITQSAPHIYLSALPFIPEESLVAKYFLPRFPRLLTLDTGKPSHWSSCVFVSEHNGGYITAIALSPDEKTFASKAAFDLICIWDSETGILISDSFVQAVRSVQSVQLTDIQCSLDFSPDGKHLVATYGQKGMVIWDVESGKEHLCFGQISERPGSPPEGSEYIASAVYSKDGNMIVSASDYNSTSGDPASDCNQGCFCRVRLWDASSGTLVRILLDIPAWCHQYSLSPGAHFLVALHPSPAVLQGVWDLTEKPPRCVIELNGIGVHPFSPLLFSADGKFFMVVTLTPGHIATARVWQTDTCIPVGPLIALGPANNTGILHHALYSYGNDNLAIGVHSNVSMKIFDATTGDVVYRGKEPTRVTSGSPSRSGRRNLLGYSDGTIRMWDYQCHMQASPVIDPTPNDHPKPWAGTAAPVFSPCGKTLAVSYGDKIKLWSTTTGEPINLSHPIQTKNNALAFSGDSRYLASLTTHDKERDELPAVINIWDVGNGMNRRQLVITHAHKEIDFHLFFASSDNRLVLHSFVADGEGERYVVRTWGDNMLGELCTTVTLACPKSPDFHQITLVLSPDTLTALILEWTPLKNIPHRYHRSSKEDQFSPHALFDAVSYHDTGASFRIRVWETKGWTEVTGPIETGGTSDWTSPMSVSISSDDRLIRSVSPLDGAIWVWDICTGRRVVEPWHGYDLSRASNIVISPNGDKLASTYSKDGSWTIKLWDTRSLHSGQEQEPVGGVGDFGDQYLTQDGWPAGRGDAASKPKPTNAKAEVQNVGLDTTGEVVSVEWAMPERIVGESETEEMWAEVWDTITIEKETVLLCMEPRSPGDRFTPEPTPIVTFLDLRETIHQNTETFTLTLHPSPLLTTVQDVAARSSALQLTPASSTIKVISGVYNSPLGTLCSSPSENRTNNVSSSLPLNSSASVVDWSAGGCRNTHDGRIWARRAYAVEARNA
ncbi:hypothetical protein D9756_011524 [Leucocoprinus leucothites]|uniref:Nephrocystin 3-like N-terminal domain-containing protein n=1 Tax=Leucocoprinus leucothites TaxID=201217 RepID=A0A8H5CMM2_9AGAR|nr:hypothetical protein D9756_011524 [Leucoagaricus leucothites]